MIRPGMIVLAGGRGRRAGGADKASLVLAGRPILAHVLDAALAADALVVVVGPPRAGFTGVRWTLEETPGSGPLAAVVAGVAALEVGCDPVFLIGGDMPYVSRGVPPLLAALTEDAAVLVSGGQDQPLASVWRRAALVDALTRVGTPEGVPLKRLFDGVAIARVDDTLGATVDVDTIADLARLNAD